MAVDQRIPGKQPRDSRRLALVYLRTYGSSAQLDYPELSTMSLVESRALEI